MPQEEAAVCCDEERGDPEHYRHQHHYGFQHRAFPAEEEEVNLNLDSLASRRSAAVKEGLRARIYSKQMLSEDDTAHSKVWHRRARMAASCSTACRLALIVSLFAVVAVACFTLPIDKMLNGFLIWIHVNLGPWGPVALALAYIPLTVFAVPASILTIGGGYLFGLPIGFLADSIGAALGATVAFLVGRTIGRPLVLAKLKDFPQFQAISSAVQHSGFKIVLLLRLVPLLPFNILNYLLSVTPISLGAYMMASWIGMMPVTGVLVYVGTTIKDLSDISHHWGHFTTFEWILLVLGLAVSVVLIALLSRIARRSLNKAILEIEGEKTSLKPSEAEAVSELCQPLIVRVDPGDSKDSKNVQHPLLN
ncbi:hypothetical protein GOP47_0001627 [Adiantum capillus-veneris]|uniref:VTT domain-containing protein n=1 Tax=Adiantum capillus-veneris TaxID=13818 RepID=A0A9D4V8Q9_ADICA|nr:hypothetical protein GOP47_0001627 [Adiantum capillus-veneris]